MPRPVPPDLRLGIIDPEDAVAVFNRRDLLLPSFEWHDVWQQEHLRGFASAGVMRYDVLQLLRDEIGIALERGDGGEAYADAVRQRLIDRGFWGKVEVTNPATGEVRTTTFNDARLRLIHDVNLGQSYMAGKAERYQRTKRYLPFLRYVTKGDERVRESHRQWDGVVLPIDDPWWDAHHPRKAWRCRCEVYAVSARQIKALREAGVPVLTEAPEEQWVDAIDRRTGDTLRLPKGVDPAFAYHPGKRPLAGAVPPPLLGDPFNRQDTLQPAPAMPTPRPAPPHALLPKGTPAEVAVDTFLATFGAATGKPVVWRDVTGEDLVISDELFRTQAGKLKAVKRGREQWVKLLALALAEPDEVWATFVTHAVTGNDMLRRRYLVRYLMGTEPGAEPVPVTAVFETGRDGWIGVTTFQAENEKYAELMLRDVRRGSRVYVRGGN